MRGIYKIYPPEVIALEAVDWPLERGEIHSIIGENGAGKSTLMKILSGLIKPSSGKIYINKHPVNFSAPYQAMQMGIGMVHQEFMLIPSFKVYENVILGNEKSVSKPGGLIDRKKSKALVNELCKTYSFEIDIDAITSEISVAAQQKVEILKQMFREVDVLIMDEPTAVLTPQETKELFERLKQLKNMGKTIVFISHKLDEVLEISDRITVMRKGKKIDTIRNKGLTKNMLANMMVGRDVIFRINKAPNVPGQPILKVENIAVNNVNKHLPGPISFEVHEGEILGVAGIEGNGQFELVEALMGTTPLSSGKIMVKGNDIVDMSVRKRRKYIGFVSEDRKSTSLALKATIMENLIMTNHIKKAMHRLPFTLNLKKGKVFSQKLVKEFSIVCRQISEECTFLSGGNQQKTVIAREFTLNTPFLLLDQPTRGLDVGTIEFIHKNILDMRERGIAILLISADLDELFNLSDRLLVLREGRIVGFLDPEKVSKEDVGAYMLGVREDA